MTPARAVVSWVLLLAVAFANGTLRELGYGRALTPQRAHQLSTLIAMVAMGAVIALLSRRWRFETSRQAWRTGLLWAGLTVAFELSFGIVRGLSWRQIAATYALWNGELWPLCVAWVTVAPWLAFRWSLRAPGSPEAAREEVRTFLAARRIAVAGVSRREEDFSRRLFEELARRGFDVIPVNPAATTIAGRPCHARVSEISPRPDAVLVLTSPWDAVAVVRDALDAGIRSVWLHRGAGLGSASPEALSLCKDRGVVPVTDLCPFMALPGAAIGHRLHGAVRRWSRPVQTRVAASAARRS